MSFLRYAILVTGLFLSTHAFSADPIVRLTTQRADHCDVPCNRTAVILIHGITGSKATWGDPDSDLYWPKMLSKEPGLSTNLDVYQIDYDSNNFSGPAENLIETALETQVDMLVQQKQYSKIAFVAHSLGGIFVRTYLMHVKLKYGHTALSRFRAVITLGTPNEGSSLATLASWATRNEQIRVLRPIDVNDFAQLVNKSLREIQEKHEGCLSLRSFAAFEKKPVLGLGIIVSEQSATSGAFSKIGFDRNHIELPKPVSINPVDPVYDWATTLIKHCVADMEDACPVREMLSCPAGDFRAMAPN